jgi:hypothetical protein
MVAVSCLLLLTRSTKPLGRINALGVVDGFLKIKCFFVFYYCRENTNFLSLTRHKTLAALFESLIKFIKFLSPPPRYLLDFLFYLVFVIVLFLFLSDKYGLSERAAKLAAASGTVITVVEIAVEGNSTYVYTVTVSMILLWVLWLLLIVREFYQMYNFKPRRYFSEPENYLEWTVLVLVLINLLPWYLLKQMGADNHLQRHLAALTLLITFIQG